jgi:hypothetical protein
MALQLGLGKNSPTQIKSSPSNYEGLIERHGQWVRWTVARKCICVTANNRPDPRCTRCRGLGYVYSFQEYETDLSVSGFAVDFETVEFKEPLEAGNIIAIRNSKGEKVTVSGVYGKYITVSGQTLPKGSLFTAVVKKNRASKLSGPARYIGKGVARINGNWLDTEYAVIPFDLIEVTSVRRQDGTTLPILSWSVDKIIIDVDVVEPDEGETLDIEARYIPPYKIAILNQNLSEADRNFLQEVGGDALAVFPFAYKIGEYDLITLWVGTQVRKKLLKKSATDLDRLADNFVSGVTVLFDATKTYIEGVDFVVWDRNNIRWLLDETTRPAEGTNLSVEYLANVTYRVLTQVPNIRSSENKRFPSRVAIKLETGTSGADQV